MRMRTNLVLLGHRLLHLLRRAASTAVVIPLASTLALAGITVDGSAADRKDIQKWLRTITGVDVVVNPNTGVITVPPGGNTSADRLRTMAQSVPEVTIKTVSGDAGVNFGGWNSSTGDPNGPTTGVQTVDMADLKGAGNKFGKYGFTPGMVLMHEITEVWEGKKNGWGWHRAHEEGLKAEKEAVAGLGAEYVSETPEATSGVVWFKYKTPAGNPLGYVIVRFDFADATLDGAWYTEDPAQPCKSDIGKTRIADPDPQVWDLDFDAVSTCAAITGVFDTTASSPRGIAHDAQGNAYVCEDLPGSQDEIRVFDPNGNHVAFLGGSEVYEPRHIDVRESTGDVFVAIQGFVLRYDASGALLGEYCPPFPFDPRGVAVTPVVPRSPVEDPGELYVTDAALGRVYAFDIEADLSTGTYRSYAGGMFVRPEGVTVDRSFLVWVADGARIYGLEWNDGNVVVHHTIHDPFADFVDVDVVPNAGLLALDHGFGPGMGRLISVDVDGAVTCELPPGTLQCPMAVETHFSMDTSLLQFLGDDIYESYCSATANSTGLPADLSGSGSASSGSGNLMLTSLPVPNQNGIFFHGANQTQLPFGNGFMCTTGGIVRGDVVMAFGNTASYTYDNSNGKHSLAAFVGSQRNFQHWFRDPAGFGALFNLSNAVAITILP